MRQPVEAASAAPESQAADLAALRAELAFLQFEFNPTEGYHDEDSTDDLLPEIPLALEREPACIVKHALMQLSIPQPSKTIHYLEFLGDIENAATILFAQIEDLDDSELGIQAEIDNLRVSLVAAARTRNWDDFDLRALLEKVETLKARAVEFVDARIAELACKIADEEDGQNIDECDEVFKVYAVLKRKVDELYYQSFLSANDYYEVYSSRDNTVLIDMENLPDELDQIPNLQRLKAKCPTFGAAWNETIEAMRGSVHDIHMTADGELEASFQKYQQVLVQIEQLREAVNAARDELVPDDAALGDAESQTAAGAQSQVGDEDDPDLAAAIAASLEDIQPGNGDGPQAEPAAAPAQPGRPQERPIETLIRALQDFRETFKIDRGSEDLESVESYSSCVSRSEYSIAQLKTLPNVVDELNTRLGKLAEAVLPSLGEEPAFISVWLEQLDAISSIPGLANIANLDDETAKQASYQAYLALQAMLMQLSLICEEAQKEANSLRFDYPAPINHDVFNKLELEQKLAIIVGALTFKEATDRGAMGAEHPSQLSPPAGFAQVLAGLFKVSFLRHSRAIMDVAKQGNGILIAADQVRQIHKLGWEDILHDEISYEHFLDFQRLCSVTFLSHLRDVCEELNKGVDVYTAIETVRIAQGLTRAQVAKDGNYGTRFLMWWYPSNANKFLRTIVGFVLGAVYGPFTTAIATVHGIRNWLFRVMPGWVMKPESDYAKALRVPAGILISLIAIPVVLIGSILTAVIYGAVRGGITGYKEDWIKTLNPRWHLSFQLRSVLMHWLSLDSSQENKTTWLENQFEFINNLYDGIHPNNVREEQVPWQHKLLGVHAIGAIVWFSLVFTGVLQPFFGITAVSNVVASVWAAVGLGAVGTLGAAVATAGMVFLAVAAVVAITTLVKAVYDKVCGARTVEGVVVPKAGNPQPGPQPGVVPAAAPALVNMIQISTKSEAFESRMFWRDGTQLGEFILTGDYAPTADSYTQFFVDAEKVRTFTRGDAEFDETLLGRVQSEAAAVAH